MQQHAYLIVVHHQWELLKILINLLDDERNDLFIHFDKKAKDAPIEIIKKSTRFSKIFVIDRISVSRGSFSLFEAELMLIKAALNSGKYSYFHLVSGQDLPLRNQDQLHLFFEEHNGYNFVDVVAPNMMKRDWKERVSLYQPFSRYTLYKPIIAIPAKGIRKIALIIQRVFRVDRFKKYEDYGHSLCFGSNWFSITEEFAEYLVESEYLIKRMFQKYTFAPEELIPQTFLWSSKFRKTLYEGDELDFGMHRANMRLVFWNGRVSPETITMEHMKRIKESTSLFARKFDYTNHPDAVNEVVKMVLSQEKRECN